MRIGIDARELCGRTTGVGRYLGGLLAEWARDRSAGSHEFILYAPRPLAVALDSHRVATRIVAGGGSWWEQVTLPKATAADHLDVFFAPAYTAPLFQRLPTVVAIHDVSFAAHPEWFTMREGIRRRWVSRHAAARARCVITISEFSRRELIERLGVRDSNIHVVPPGVTRPLHSTQARRPPKVLFVGSIFNRRHVPELIRAFGALALVRPDASLDIVGDNRSYPREDLRAAIEAESLTDVVRWREYVEDDQLKQLYASSRAFAFLSEYEGLGLTPLEALAAGVPPLLLDTPVARESCGRAALYVSSVDIRAISEGLERVLYDDDTRSAILAAAPEALAKYDWPKAARETLAVIEAAV